MSRQRQILRSVDSNTSQSSSDESTDSNNSWIRFPHSENTYIHPEYNCNIDEISEEALKAHSHHSLCSHHSSNTTVFLVDNRPTYCKNKSSSSCLPEDWNANVLNDFDDELDYDYDDRCNRTYYVNAVTTNKVKDNNKSEEEESSGSSRDSSVHKKSQELETTDIETSEEEEEEEGEEIIDEPVFFSTQGYSENDLIEPQFKAFGEASSNGSIRNRVFRYDSEILPDLQPSYDACLERKYGYAGRTASETSACTNIGSDRLRRIAERHRENQMTERKSRTPSKKRIRNKNYSPPNSHPWRNRRKSRKSRKGRRKSKGGKSSSPSSGKSIVPFPSRATTAQSRLGSISSYEDRYDGDNVFTDDDFDRELIDENEIVDEDSDQINDELEVRPSDDKSIQEPRLIRQPFFQLRPDLVYRKHKSLCRVNGMIIPNYDDGDNCCKKQCRVARYVDDRNGTAHNWCKSGYPRLFVYKVDFGKVPEYIQERLQDEADEFGYPYMPTSQPRIRYDHHNGHGFPQSCCGVTCPIHEEETKTRLMVCNRVRPSYNDEACLDYNNSISICYPNWQNHFTNYGSLDVDPGCLNRCRV